MRGRLLSLFLLAFIFVFSGCVKDDLSDLQNQIDDLNQKVDDLEEAQQQELLTAITQLQTAISALETTNAEQYTEMLTNLQAIEEEVANNATAIYYGNLLTDADFAALQSQGATIVTGKVVASKAEHYTALANVKLIGGTFTVQGNVDVDLQMLENVGEDLLIAGITGDVSVAFDKLASVGGDLELMNTSITSFVADELVLIKGRLNVENNPTMASLSLAKLDVTEEVYINGFWNDDPDYIGLGSLTTLDLSSTNVLGDLHIEYVSGGVLNVGEVDGSFYVSNTKLTELVLGSAVIEGDFTLQHNGNLATTDFSTLTTIEGDVSVSFNSTDWFDYMAPTGLDALPAFEALESIGGDVRVEGNGYLTSLETFNSVTEFTGSQIFVASNGSNGTGLTYINIFNALEDGGPATWTKLDINVIENSAWFDGFNKLLEANNINLNVSGVLDQNTWMNGPTKIEGFALMTACKSLQLYAKNAEEFTAFASLDNFKGWGVTNCMTLEMPEDTNVGMCSMEPIFNKILNGDFDSKPAVFNYNWSPMDNADAVAQLLAPCN
jgi:hypothetical protein